MTRLNVFVRSVLLLAIVVAVLAAPFAAGLSASGSPSSSTAATPSGVCTPSWGSIVVPICV
jgi:hypothetical protein